MTHIGNRISDARASLKLSMREVASKIGCSATAINDWEKGKTSPNAEYIYKLSELLNISAIYLLTGVSTEESEIFKYPVFDSLEAYTNKIPIEYFKEAAKHPEGSFWWQVQDTLMSGKHCEYYQFTQGSYVLTYPADQDDIKNGDYVLIQDKDSKAISVRYYLSEHGVIMFFVGDSRFSELNGTPRTHDILGKIAQHKTFF